jgi:hypothetical protein
MSEPFLKRLSRFTPDTGRLDRDALLFAAGRSSARPNRGWMTLASVLASTQVLSLVLLWPWPQENANSPTGRFTAAVANQRASPPPAAEPQPAGTSAGTRLWSAHQSLQEALSDYRPRGNVKFIDSGPTLRASRPIPASLLN